MTVFQQIVLAKNHWQSKGNFSSKIQPTSFLHLETRLKVLELAKLTIHAYGVSTVA